MQYNNCRAPGRRIGCTTKMQSTLSAALVLVHVLWRPKAWRKQRCSRSAPGGNGLHDISACLRHNASCFYSCASTSLAVYEAAARGSSHYDIHVRKTVRISLGFPSAVPLFSKHYTCSSKVPNAAGSRDNRLIQFRPRPAN